MTTCPKITRNAQLKFRQFGYTDVWTSVQTECLRIKMRQLHIFWLLGARCAELSYSFLHDWSIVGRCIFIENGTHCAFTTLIMKSSVLAISNNLRDWWKKSKHQNYGCALRVIFLDLIQYTEIVFSSKFHGFIQNETTPYLQIFKCALRGIFLLSSKWFINDRSVHSNWKWHALRVIIPVHSSIISSEVVPWLHSKLNNSISSDF